MIDPKLMAMLMGGASMMDPRGTYGSAGAALNNAMQAAMGTYLPLVQWQAKLDQRKEDRDYQKKRDRVADRHMKNTESLQAMQLGISQFNSETGRISAEAQMQNADVNAGLKDIQAQMLQIQLDNEKQRMEWVRQFMPGGETLASRGPMKGTAPYNQDPVKQNFGLPPIPSWMPTSAVPQPAPDVATQAPAQYQPQAPAQYQPQGGMNPYTMMTAGNILKLPGLEQQGKDQIEIANFIQKEMIKEGMKANDIEIVKDQFGQGYTVISKKTGEPIRQYDSRMRATNNPNIKVIK